MAERSFVRIRGQSDLICTTVEKINFRYILCDFLQ